MSPHKEGVSLENFTTSSKKSGKVTFLCMYFVCIKCNEEPHLTTYVVTDEDGHKSESSHRSQAGLRALQTARP